MYFMTFNMNGSKRPCRAEVLTCSATDAPFFIYCRDSQRIRIIRILADKLDRSDRTVAGTVSTTDIVCVHNAVVKIHYCMSYLD